MKELFSKTRKEYEEISQLVESEKRKSLHRLINSFASLDDSEDNKSDAVEDSSERRFERNIEEHIAMLSLLSLRVKAGCALIRLGFQGVFGQLSVDIDKLISCVQTIEYVWEDSDDVRSDAYDLLRAICLSEDKIIIDRSYYWNLPFITHKIITRKTISLFEGVAQYLRSIDRFMEADHMLESLCLLSRKRANPNHLTLVYRIVSQIYYVSPETACRICDIEQTYFSKNHTLLADDFYWFYGSSLMQIGRLEDALHAFDESFQLRKASLGEEVFLTEIARREMALCRWDMTKGLEGKEDLLRFVDLTEAGIFKDDIDLETVQIIEAKTLGLVLKNAEDFYNLDKYRYYLTIYQNLCLKYQGSGEIFISMRSAWNMWGQYYLLIGEYIQAEVALTNALEVPVPDEKSSFLSKELIKSNLLLMYYIQNDLEKAYPLAKELLDQIQEDESGEVFTDLDVYRINTIYLALEMQSLADPDKEEIDEVKTLLVESCEDILNDEVLKASSEEISFIITCVFYLLHYEDMDYNDYKFYSLVFNAIEEENYSDNLNSMQLVTFYYCQALLLWNNGAEEAHYYFKKAMNHFGDYGVQRNLKAAIRQSYAAFLCRQGEFNLGRKIIEESLNGITLLWRQYVRYINDTRLLMILMPVQMIFSGCYAILRQITEIDESYEYLLQFKMLASLAGRERNRIIHGCELDHNLLEHIQRTQNTIATLESENMFRDVERDCQKQEEDLRRMEKEFAVRFPQNVQFTDITLKAVQEKIPDDTVVIEYFFTVDTYGQTQLERDETDITIFDVYITTKKSGNCQLHHVKIPNGLAVAEDARLFILTMQHISLGEATIDEISGLDHLRTRLYNALILPVLPYIEGYGTVYIAPDNELLNLPFDLLYNEERRRLADRHICVKIECARDFLFETTGHSGDNRTLIISYPTYEVMESELGADRTDIDDSDNQRSMNLNIDALESLPFSKEEADRISRRTGGNLYTETIATKQVVLSAESYDNIHIATHGYFDLNYESESLYSSCLAFSGIKNWYRTGKVDPIYGSGLLTADEVSRMNLSSTNLVVLSSCLSGMNDVFINAGFHGMVSAFSAAGVKYVISSLWTVDDLATAVFMDAFYYYYIDKEDNPAIALRQARDYLKSVTIEGLRRQGWFQPSIYQMLDRKGQEKLHSMENKDGRTKPFRNESFWGAFSCYQCR